MRFRAWLCALSLVAGVARMEAMEPGQVAKEYRTLVPQRLLPLLHAPEVHQELRLSSTQVRDLETWFAEVDGDWFRARLLSSDKSTEVIANLEARTHQWLMEHFDSKQRDRLRQLELQAQGTRCLLRNDVSKEIRLDTTQRARIAKLAASSELAQLQLEQAKMKGESVTQLQSKATDAAKAEKDGVDAMLGSEVRRKLQTLLGASFDTSRLRRIYPMAPELVPVDEWINSPALTLRELRGKVVLIHFYAFQCHNCQANFEIYRRWHDTLRDQGVVVIGIQTPETREERNAASVRAAAKEQKLDFPILIDLQSENWKAWGNTMWPTVYVVDKNGYLRLWWQGELNWKGATGDKSIEDAVQLALAEPDLRD